MINQNNHVFLISEMKFSNTNEIIEMICKAFLDNVDHSELFKRKIANKNYYDYLEFNLYLDELKIETIKEMKKRFFSVSLESAGFKFYVIRNIELLSKKVANSLLKFIEEPAANTIAIFTTKNPNKVLPTIYSRCEEIKSQSNLEEVKRYLKDHHLSDLKNFYLNAFYSLNEIILFQTSKNKNLIIDLYHQLQGAKDDELKLMEFANQFKKLSTKEIAILINGLMSILPFSKKQKLLELLNNLKYNLSKTLIFNEIITLI
ncbi:MAG: hypothetical protein ACRCVI_01235 [Mycoplasmoidaceae bacterium]